MEDSSSRLAHPGGWPERRGEPLDRITRRLKRALPLEVVGRHDRFVLRVPVELLQGITDTLEGKPLGLLFRRSQIPVDEIIQHRFHTVSQG